MIPSFDLVIILPPQKNKELKMLSQQLNNFNLKSMDL